MNHLFQRRKGLINLLNIVPLPRMRNDHSLIFLFASRNLFDIFSSNL